MEKKKFVYGIDLGTTYSCIAYVDESGKPVVINNKLTNVATTPSVVLFESESKAVVGETAKASAVLEPDNTFDFVKQSMGKEGVIFMHHGKTETPEQISSYILKEIAQGAAEMIGNEVKDVVVTCPAYFGTAEREATKAAGILAGLNVMEIISEPTAAAIFYGCTKAKRDQNILIYDLGGGTFDVTVMRITKDMIEEICKDGNHELGGRNWDNIIIRYLWDAYCKETNYSGEFDDYAQQVLKAQAEKLKKDLTQKDNASAMLNIGTPKRIGLSRETFDRLTVLLLDSTIKLTNEVINRAKTNGCTIDKILLVGGSTKMPQVKERLQREYNLEPEILEPDEAVAKGAAIFAVEAYTNSSDPEVKEEKRKRLDSGRIGGVGSDGIKIVTSTTKSYAIEMLLNGITPKCNNLIIKDTPLPDGKIERSKQYGTVVSNQENVKIAIYESDFIGEYYEVDPAFLLDEALLQLPGNLPANAPIAITFILSREGLLRVTAKDVTSNREINMEVNTIGGLSKERLAELQAETSKTSVTDQTSDCA